MLPFIDRHLSMHFKHISLTFSATVQNKYYYPCSGAERTRAQRS